MKWAEEQAVRSVQEAYDDATQGVLDDDMSDTFAMVPVTDLFTLLEMVRRIRVVLK